jgi:hypothetical protein
MKTTSLKILTVICLLVIFLGCRSQSTKEKINNTTHEVLKYLKEGDEVGFKKIIGVDDLLVIGKNEEMIASDVKIYDSLFNKYFSGKMPDINITNLYNRSGQMQVKIQFYKTDDGKQIKELHLDLLFGPPNIIPLDKLSGYKLVQNDSDSSSFYPLSYWQRLQGR